MTPARFGGVLFVVGVVALPNTAGPATITAGPGSALLSAGAVLAFGVGAALISASAPRPFRGTLARAGLALLAMAAIAGAVSAVAGIGYEGDPLSSWAIIAPLLVALVAGIAGLVSIAIALVRSRGVARAVGLAMGLGLALLIPLGAVFGDAGRVLSAGLVVFGLLGVGVLAVGFGRLERVESA